MNMTNESQATEQIQNYLNVMSKTLNQEYKRDINNEQVQVLVDLFIKDIEAICHNVTKPRKNSLEK